MGTVSYMNPPEADKLQTANSPRFVKPIWLLGLECRQAVMTAYNINSLNTQLKSLTVSQGSSFASRPATATPTTRLAMTPTSITSSRHSLACTPACEQAPTTKAERLLGC